MGVGVPGPGCHTWATSTDAAGNWRREQPWHCQMMEASYFAPEQLLAPGQLSLTLAQPPYVQAQSPDTSGTFSSREQGA